MAATDDSRFLSKTQYEVTLQRLAQVTGRTLGADSQNGFKADLSSSDRVLGSWTHPTNGTTGAKTLDTSNQVIKTLVFDNYGHVTGATQGALVAADIPSLSWSKITSGKPTTLSGYGITDAKIEVNTAGAATITLGSNTVSIRPWAQGTGATTGLYIGTTQVQTSSANQALTGITTGAFSSNVTIGGNLTVGTSTSAKVTTLYGTLSASGNTTIGGTLTVGTSSANKATTLNGTLSVTGAATMSSTLSVAKAITLSGATDANRRIYFGGSDYYLELKDLGSSASPRYALHSNVPFYSDSWISALGAGSGSGGGGGVDGIDILRAWADYSADDETQVLGSNLGYAMNQRITALENSSTSVTFAQTLTSGKEIGTLTIDGASVKLYAPSSYALSDITGADDLKAIEAITGTSGVLQKTAANTWSLVSKTDSSSASAISTGTGLVTERDVYYGLPKINNAHNYTSSSAYYAPTTGGTAGYLLKAKGATSAPEWASVADIMSAYATTAAMNDAIADAIADVTQIDYVVSWNGTSAPTVANIPKGVKVVYNGTTYTGTKATGTKGTIYLVYSSNGLIDSYDEYMYFTSGSTGFWERLGSFGETNLADYWLKNDLVAITATENTTLLNSYFPA